MDLVKAFDKMVLKGVLLDLWKARIRGKMWRMVYEINKKASVKIITTNGTTQETWIGETLKQGSVLASTLAALHTDDISKYFENSGLGIHYGTIHIQNLLFQDDIVRLENTAHNMNTANKINENFQDINRMQFHQKKTVWMATRTSNEEILLNNEIVEHVTYTLINI